MKITLENGAELEVLGVHGQTVLHEGVQRDSLTVLMDPEVVDLEQALAAFAPSACGTITLTDDDGTYVHEHYTIRLEAGMGYKDYALSHGSTTGDRKQVVYVRMARSTLAERTLQSQQDALDALVLAALEGGDSNV